MEGLPSVFLSPRTFLIRLSRMVSPRSGPESATMLMPTKATFSIWTSEMVVLLMALPWMPRVHSWFFRSRVRSVTVVPEELVARTRTLAGASSVPPGIEAFRTAPAPSRKGTASGMVREPVVA